jgi:hypothetical protein
MSKRIVLIVLIAVVVAALLSGMIASSLTAGGSGNAEHEMPDGSTMQGERAVGRDRAWRPARRARALMTAQPRNPIRGWAMLPALARTAR